jgi:hypothetical protein
MANSEGRMFDGTANAFEILSGRVELAMTTAQTTLLGYLCRN